jgi:EpsI family protein
MLLNLKAYLVSIVFLLVTLLSILLIAQRGVPMVTRTNLENLPMQIGTYSATVASFSDSVYEELNADFHLYRHYNDPNGNVISLYIGYYGTAKGGRTGHNPYACLPGAGWGIIQSDKISLINGSGEAYVNALVARKGDLYETVWHWYQSDRDKVLATGIKQDFQRFKGRVMYNRNDGAFVRLSMVTPREGLSQVRDIIKPFAENVLRLLPHYWPEEQ